MLCRLPNETQQEFSERVLRRTRRILTSQRISCVWYVVGESLVAGHRGTNGVRPLSGPHSEDKAEPSSLPLVHALLTMLDAGSTLTVVGPGSKEGAVVEWLESLLHRRSEVTVRARLYPHTARRGTVFCRRSAEWMAEGAPRASLSHPAPLPSHSLAASSLAQSSLAQSSLAQSSLAQSSRSSA